MKKIIKSILITASLVLTLAVLSVTTIGWNTENTYKPTRMVVPKYKKIIGVKDIVVKGYGSATYLLNKKYRKFRISFPKDGRLREIEFKVNGSYLVKDHPEIHPRIHICELAEGYFPLEDIEIGVEDGADDRVPSIAVFTKNRETIIFIYLIDFDNGHRKNIQRQGRGDLRNADINGGENIELLRNNGISTVESRE